MLHNFLSRPLSFPGWTTAMLFWLDFHQTQSNLYKWFRIQRHDWSSTSPKEHMLHLSLSPCTGYQLQLASSSRHWCLHITTTGLTPTYFHSLLQIYIPSRSPSYFCSLLRIYIPSRSPSYFCSLLRIYIPSRSPAYFHSLLRIYIPSRSPAYFHSLLRIYIPSRSLRSASERRLVVSSQRGSKSLSRTFSFTVPGWWNDLQTPPPPSGLLDPCQISSNNWKLISFETTWLHPKKIK